MLKNKNKNKNNKTKTKTKTHKNDFYESRGLAKGQAPGFIKFIKIVKFIKFINLFLENINKNKTNKCLLFLFLFLFLKKNNEFNESWGLAFGQAQRLNSLKLGSGLRPDPKFNEFNRWARPTARTPASH